MLIRQDRSVQVGNLADSFASVAPYGIFYFPPKEQFKCRRGTMLLVFPRMKLKPYEPDLMNSNLNFVCLCIRVEDNFCLPQNTSSVNTFDILHRIVKHLLAQGSIKTAYFSKTHAQDHSRSQRPRSFSSGP